MIPEDGPPWTFGSSSLAQLDATEADVIAAARAMRHLIPPPGRMGSNEQMLSDDAFYMGWRRLMDALDRMPEEAL